MSRVSDLYGAGEAGDRLQGRWAMSEKVVAVLQKRHRQYRGHIDEQGYFVVGEDRWKVPYGVRLCLRLPLVWTQIVRRTPWFVTWESPKTGKRLRKSFSTPYSAMVFITTLAQRVDKNVALVSHRCYDIPAQLRGKIPAPWKWCPRCMTARRFHALRPQETFYANRKEWIEEKGRYEFRDRQLRLTRCTHCGLTNRDTTMRRSNQPWTIRKFKQGVRRARRQR